MSGQETRITRVSEMRGLELSGESRLVCIYFPQPGTAAMLGRQWTLRDGSLGIGRGQHNDIVLDLDNVSRRHCELTFKDEGVTLVDLDSTNGTYLNHQEVKRCQVQSGDHIKVGGAIFKYLSGQNVETLYHEEIYQMTIMDGLTGVHNKRYLTDSLQPEMARSQRFGRPLHIAIFDLDHFKRINDDYGHLAGDLVLRELAGLVRSMVRTEEIFARYGGEEFALVVPESSTEQVARYAEKIRAAVAAHTFVFEGQELKVTLSMGLTALDPQDTDPLTFIARADGALYEAKRRGRNQVAIAEGS